MKNPLVDELLAKFSEVLNRSPVRDMEQNAKALVKGALHRMEMVSREDLDQQQDALAQALTRIAVLEARVAELEAQRNVLTQQSSAQ